MDRALNNELELSLHRASSSIWSKKPTSIRLRDVHTERKYWPADAARLCEAYVKRQKNDATDAKAICEAVARPNMRFVATKTPEQQSWLTLHRARHLLIRQQTSVVNAIRSHLAAFCIVAPVGRNGVDQLLGIVADVADKRLPERAFCRIPNPIDLPFPAALLFKLVRFSPPGQLPNTQ
jgi:transposase